MVRASVQRVTKDTGVCNRHHQAQGVVFLGKRATACRHPKMWIRKGYPSDSVAKEEAPAMRSRKGHPAMGSWRDGPPNIRTTQTCHIRSPASARSCSRSGPELGPFFRWQSTLWASLSPWHKATKTGCFPSSCVDYRR